MADIQIRVMPALWLRGSRKAVMPFEMASTPVSADVPLEKARSSRKSLTACAWPYHLHGRRVDHRAQRPVR